MSRLDAEYDPAEHHDLDRIETYPLTPAPGEPVRHIAVCACGEQPPSQASRDAAFQAWDAHRHQEWFG